MRAYRTMTRRVAAVLSVLGLAGSLAAITAGAAQASVPDKWGFAFVANPAAPGVPPLSHQAGSWTSGHVTSHPGLLGQVFVVFPHLASKNGVVHVTAVNANAVWCQAQKWGQVGANEVASVRCYLPGGKPTFSQFTVLYTTSTKGAFSGGAYGYVHYEPGSGIVGTFNSVGAVNTVTAGPPGVWVVNLPGLGSAPAGDIQVTAADPSGAAKCELNGWAANPTGQHFQVRCYDGGVAPLKTGWSLSYQRSRAIFGGVPKLFAYTFNDQPTVPGPYAPLPPAVNFNSLHGVNNISQAGGRSLERLPRVGTLPSTVLVTAVKIGAGFCNLESPWAISAGEVLIRNVVCFTAAGAPKPFAWMTTYTAAH